MTDLKHETKSYTVIGHQCQYGLTTEVDGEKRLVKKPTKFLTSSWFVARALNKMCQGGHLHFTRMEGRAAEAAKSPDKLGMTVSSWRESWTGSALSPPPGASGPR